MTTPTTEPSPSTTIDYEPVSTDVLIDTCLITDPDLGTGTTRYHFFVCDYSWNGPIEIPLYSTTTIVAVGQPPLAQTLPETGLKTNISVLATLVLLIGILIKQISVRSAHDSE